MFRVIKPRVTLIWESSFLSRGLIVWSNWAFWKIVFCAARQHVGTETNVVKSTEEWHLFLCSLSYVVYEFGPSNNHKPGKVRPSYFEYRVLAYNWVLKQGDLEHTTDGYLLVAFLDPLMFVFYTWGEYPWRSYSRNFVELLLLYEMWL